MSLHNLFYPDTLTHALFGDAIPRVIAVVGAGGKTSSIRTMAAELHTMGRRVIITTTTKMHPPGDTTTFADTTEKAAALLDSGRIAWVGQYYNEYKMELIPGSLPALCAMAEHVLIEADGAKMRPLKMIDRSHEPVIPPETDAVVAVAGLDAVGNAVADIVHRPELACEALGTDMAHIVTVRDVAALLRLCYAPEYVILNKADTPERRAYGAQIAALLPQARCIVTSLRASGNAEPERKKDGTAT